MRVKLSYNPIHSARARLQSSKAEEAGAYASYRQAVLLALEDFENACHAVASNHRR